MRGSTFVWVKVIARLRGQKRLGKDCERVKVGMGTKDSTGNDARIAYKTAARV